MSKVKIKISRPVTIHGDAYDEGKRISVDSDTADWLIAQQAAERVITPAKKTNDSDNDE